ncbi:transcriptional regulator, AraC family [Pseudomonas pohangensis]|uniref:Transcriptional regulator, AraC family n=1 Tax=Pseudomonas pohangensis TaxID=364197 RepID=A0A1H2FAQ1_9PSED|nr:AraC family transcriptional regulator [Pseudomonas pohangensis]SDU04419.1 transcriptional regulator, AraC family [Pseudomonas pohangensis]
MPSSIAYTCMLARQLRLDEAGQQELLAGTSITLESLRSLELLISDEDYAVVISNALRLSGNPAFGLEMGSRLHIAAHGPLGQLLATAPNLNEAWAVLERYHEIRIPVTYRRSFEGGDMLIHLDVRLSPDEVARCLIEGMVIAVQDSMELMMGRKVTEARFQFAYAAPAYAEQYAQYLHSPHSFDAQETTVLIPKAVLHNPNLCRDNLSFELALRQCEQLQHDQRQGEAWKFRVIRVLQNHAGQILSSEQVARHFNLSSRTLMRYLKAEGCSYQELLDGELGRQAKACLESPRHTVESVALALGYQDESAFRRAFKRWFGITPSEYKIAHRAR